MRQRKNAAATAAGRAPEDENSPPVTTKAMSTTRIFQNYCAAAVELEGSPAVIGDKSMKVLRIDMAKWGTEDFLTVAADIEIEGCATPPRAPHPLSRRARTILHHRAGPGGRVGGEGRRGRGEAGAGGGVGAEWGRSGAEFGRMPECVAQCGAARRSAASG